MSEANKFVEEWCRESNKNGFERYVAEQREDAAEKAALKAETKGILKTAKNMLIDNVEIPIIEKYTGLSKVELNKLKKEIC